MPINRGLKPLLKELPKYCGEIRR